MSAPTREAEDACRRSSVIGERTAGDLRTDERSNDHDHGRRHRRPRLSRARGGAKLRARGWRVFWLGTRDGMEATLVPQHGVEFGADRFGGMRGKGSSPRCCCRSRCWSRSGRRCARHPPPRPDVVLGFGGFAFPGGMMAALLGRAAGAPRANAVAGLANRVLADVADRDPARLPRRAARQHAKRRVGRQSGARRDRRVAAAGAALRRPRGPLRLLVVGGSLGARR